MKIIKNRKYFYAISLTCILLGIVFMAINSFNKKGAFNLSIEFTGGTVVDVNLGHEYNEEDVKDLVIGVTNDKNAQVQKVVDSENYEVIVKIADKEMEAEEVTEDTTDVTEEPIEIASAEEETVTDDGLPSNEEVIEQVKAMYGEETSYTDLVLKAFELKYGTTNESIVEISNLSATVGDEMTNNAVFSVLIACICILVYISFRFNDTKMGLAAILALVHDVLIVLAFCAIFRLSIGNSFIAAMLTIVGYSINNTIVIFDRVRENSKGNNRAHKDLLVDKSVTETLTRTINTSVTTLVSVLALYVLGVDSIREFILPIIVGIVAGTWSSVTISGSLWYDMLHIGKKSK
ncbi:MAG: protein translocase subunit SecF [Clostridia bacterium]|nr:protein translocase subunit SecF [Clostridia bacterium]